LFRIAINVCRKQPKERNRFHGYELDPKKLADSHEFDRGSDDRHSLIRVAFESLDAKDRLILALFCIDQIRCVEILGVPEGTVWSRLHHAKKRLQQKVTLRQKGESW
jgi:RNA polymerase sigma-70 factor (ECF subfamily)